MAGQVREGNYDVILYDGYCAMCSWIVRFVVKRDRRARYRFAALDSAAGKALLEQAGQAGSPGEAAPDTFRLIRDGRVYIKSKAALEVVRKLGGLWPVLLVFAAVPARFRDFVYDTVARNRYRWFGRNESCLLPPPEVRDRFLQ
ncbi:DCC1-like thiol-disulfide oxidoreductase family protein [Paenibacillus sp. GYB004]|uniref:thiol-disulfide oxidoreductase DCC family protein n=1 Tax=Paenibacillus sp. GYB004 TaxID=2994393 RepID=UPI002F96C221